MTATQPDAYTVTLVDPNRLSREGVARLLSEHGYAIGEGYPDLRACLDDAAAAGQRPDVCVIDSSALSDDAEEDIRQVREHLPGTRIVVFTKGDEPNAVLACLLAKADGCLMKDMSIEAMVNTLRLATLGERTFPSRVVASLLPDKREQSGHAHGMPLEVALCDPSDCNLSEREKDVLACLAAGHPNKQIGFQTGLSESTVKIHLRNIMQKIGASNCTQAAIWALRNGIVHTYTAAE